MVPEFDQARARGGQDFNIVASGAGIATAEESSLESSQSPFERCEDTCPLYRIFRMSQMREFGLVRKDVETWCVVVLEKPAHIRHCGTPPTVMAGR